MKIQYKLLLSFLCIAATVVVVGLVGLQNIITIKSTYYNASQRTLPQLLRLENLRYYGTRIVYSTSRLALLKYGITHDQAQTSADWQSELLELQDSAIRPLEEALNEYSALIDQSSADDKLYLMATRDAAQFVKTSSDNIVTLLKNNDTAIDLTEALNTMENGEHAFEAALDSQLFYTNQQLTKDDTEVNQTISNAENMLLAAGIMTFLFAIGLSLVNARSLASPLKQLVTSASELGRGHFDARAPEWSRDEIGQLARAFNLMANNLATTTVSKEQMNNILRSVPDALIVINACRHIEWINSAASALFKYHEDELLGRSIDDFIADPMFVRSMLDSLIISPYVQGMETTFINKEGNLIPVSISSSLFSDHVHCGGLVLVLQDITMRKKTEDHLLYLANYDALTNLPNRSLLLDRIDRALTRAPRHNQLVAILFCDLDGFKLINDTYGHNMGDHMLKIAAQRLTTCIRAEDTVARHGGDEFVVILNDLTNQHDACQVAQKIINIFSKPFEIRNHQFFIGVSIGITISPNDGEDAETLLKNADVAMYRVKEQGKNAYQLYSPNMNLRAQTRLSLEKDLHRALDNDEFLIYYQPRIHVPSGTVVAMEALVRWQHPTKGVIPPEKFLAVAEETSLILPLGKQMLHKACSDYETWVTAGLTVPRIAVNLSDKEFRNRDLLSNLKSILSETRLQPSSLELELTERIFSGDVKSTLLTLEKLEDVGVHLCIDDFGTGYSSLSKLNHTPIRTIKIDRSFTSHICSNDDDATTIAAIIAMANTLQLEIVAEGVETKTQLDLLQRLGCQTMQGYYFSQALKPEDVPGLLAAEISDQPRRHSL
jgi:diguanylate cyclase (GGDEF)-like protein/PAS domain S-box-containing protein